jgi:hypothetical protein
VGGDAGVVPEANRPGADRLCAVRPLAERLERAGAVSVLVTGSVAAGWADRWSDVELLAVWMAVPAPAEREGVAESVGATAFRSFPGDGPESSGEDDLLLGGLKCDLAHTTVGAVDAAITRLGDADDPDPALGAQRLAASLLGGVVLSGGAPVAGWRADLDPYPPGLATRTLTGALRLGLDAWLRMLAERADPLPLHDVMVRAGRALLVAWSALSGCYVATTDGKWAGRHAARLPVTPARAAERLAGVFRLQPTEAAAELSALVGDTLDMCEVRFGPELTAVVRRRVEAQGRDPDWVWEGPSS